MLIDDIRKVLKKDYVSFAELSRIDGFKGDYSMRSRKYENVIWWAGMSEEALDALDELERRGEFHFHQADQLIYLLDGVALKLPMVKSVRSYKTPHWIPVCLKLGPGPCRDQSCPKREKRG